MTVSFSPIMCVFMYTVMDLWKEADYLSTKLLQGILPKSKARFGNFLAEVGLEKP